MIASKIPLHIQENLMGILKTIEDEDMYIRQRMLREAKQLELYWHGFQYIFWDERAQDFRVPTHDVIEQASTREESRIVYDYVVNIFKAHGLSIIAALSADIPGVPFSPCDPSNIKDVLAARKAEALGKVIMKQNRAKMLFYHALFTLFTNHFVASYTYYERDKKYGTVEIPKYNKQIIPGETTYDCADCEYSSSVDPGRCPHCGEELQENTADDQEETTQDGTEEVEKGRQRIRVRGTLNVKLPVWAADQESCGYLIDYYDQHFSQLRALYPEIRDKITNDATDNFERIARMPSIGRLYSDTYLSSLQTLKRVWLRPSQFEVLDKDEADELKKMFPDGVYFACINENVFAEAENACLDESWTIAKADLSRAVHGDPLGKPLLPMQDVENMLTNLMIESIEHSIPSSFADPQILDFETYSKQEVLPGAIYPIKDSINSQKRLDDYFYTLKTSTLPKEAVDFNQLIDNKGQFVVGAFPSIFGGPQTEGSKTLGEYQESRNYAMQRLSIPYQMLFFWWSDTIHKGVCCYIENMITDETHALPTSAANGPQVISVELLMDDFKAGRFEQLIPEAATDLPISFSQKRSNVQQMVQLNSDVLNQFLFSPENRGITLKFLGIEEFSDLDSNQAIKQLCEIQDMSETGQVAQIEPQVDEHEVHLRVLRNMMASEHGQEVKKFAPAIYELWMEHAQQHYQFLMSTIQPSPDSGEDQPQPGQNNNNVQKPPINKPTLVPAQAGGAQQ